MAKKKKAIMTPTTLATIRGVQLKPELEEFKTAADVKAAYDKTHEKVKQTATASVTNQKAVIEALARMRAILSQRGTEKLRKDAGITQGWTQYFAWFQREYKLQMSLRTVINKIDLLSGKKLCPECKKAHGHTPSCSKRIGGRPLTVLESKLLGTATAGHDLVKAIRQCGNTEAAIKEFESCAPTLDRILEYSERPVMANSNAAVESLAIKLCKLISGDEKRHPKPTVTLAQQLLTMVGAQEPDH